MKYFEKIRDPKEAPTSANLYRVAPGVGPVQYLHPDTRIWTNSALFARTDLANPELFKRSKKP